MYMQPCVWQNAVDSLTARIKLSLEQNKRFDPSMYGRVAKISKNRSYTVDSYGQKLTIEV